MIGHPRIRLTAPAAVVRTRRAESPHSGPYEDLRLKRP